MQTINANGTTKTEGQNSNMGIIFGGIIAGIVAIFTAIGIVTFVPRQRRRRHSRPRSVRSTDSVHTGPQIIVIPFDANSYDANQDLGISAEQQPLVIGDPEAEMVTSHRLSSSPPTVLPPLRKVSPVSAGLSDKEIARLRAEALSSPRSHKFRVTNMTQSTSSLNAVTESEESLHDSRRLHTEFESLRREVEQLRAEGLVGGAPPSYESGDE